MTVICIELPEKMDYSDYLNIEDLIADSHQYFLSDLYNEKIRFRGKNIFFFDSPIIEGYEQGFYHCTTSSSEMRSGRFHDVDRLERIVWIKSIIMNCDIGFPCSNDILYWIDPLSKKTHIYLYSEKYLIVLEEKETIYNFITSFYVDSIPQHKKLLRKYDENKV